MTLQSHSSRHGAPNWLSGLIEKIVWDLEILELFSRSFIQNQDNSLSFLPATPYPTPSPSNSCRRLHRKPLQRQLAHRFTSLIPSPPLAPPQRVTVHPAVSLNFVARVQGDSSVPLLSAYRNHIRTPGVGKSRSSDSEPQNVKILIVDTDPV